MSTQEELENLFKGWKDKHEKEFENNKESIYKKAEEYYKAFAPDGPIGRENQWDNLAKDNKNKVLYILVEPNWEADKDIKDNYFWFQSIVDPQTEEEKEQQKKQQGNMILRKLAIAQYLLESKDYKPENFDLKDFQPKEEDFERLKNAAYMNLKKRGGGAARIDKKLKDYIEEYNEKIIAEIKILNPDIIVCCGNGIDKRVKELSQDFAPKVIACHHPSAREGYEPFFNNLKKNYDI